MIELVSFGGYPRDVIIAIGVDTPELLTYIGGLGFDVEPIEIEFDKGDFGITAEVGSKVLIRLESFDGSAAAYGCLAHEIHHAVCTTMKQLGIPQHKKTEEAYSYAIQDLTTKIVPLLPCQKTTCAT